MPICIQIGMRTDSQNSLVCCIIENVVLGMVFENPKAAVCRCGLRTQEPSQKPLVARKIGDILLKKSSKEFIHLFCYAFFSINVRNIT